MQSRDDQLLLERTGVEGPGAPLAPALAARTGSPASAGSPDGSHERPPRPLIELCRRHVPLAWRTAMAITADSGEATQAVTRAFRNVLSAEELRADEGVAVEAGPALRAQLLAATREAAVAYLRRAGPPQTSNIPPPLRPSDMSSRVTAAFGGLPERWRTVLWLVEVERIPSSEAARIIGVPPEAISALTEKAWGGLADAALGGLGAAPVSPRCQSRSQLFARFSGNLHGAPPGELGAHLSACASCAEYQHQLEAVAVTLRQVVMPLPEGLLAATAPPAPAGLPANPSSPRAAAKPGTPLVRVWLAALGLGIIGVAVLDQSSTPLPPAAPRFSATVPQSAPTVILPSSPTIVGRSSISLAQHPAQAGTSQTSASVGASASADPQTSQQASTGPTAPAPSSATSPARSNPTQAAPPSAPLLVLPASPGPQLVTLDTGLLGIPVALNVGACTGLQLGPLNLGCTSP